MQATSSICYLSLLKIFRHSIIKYTFYAQDGKPLEIFPDGFVLRSRSEHRPRFYYQVTFSQITFPNGEWFWSLEYREGGESILEGGGSREQSHEIKCGRVRRLFPPAEHFRVCLRKPNTEYSSVVKPKSQGWHHARRLFQKTELAQEMK